jgi:integrase
MTKPPAPLVIRDLPPATLAVLEAEAQAARDFARESVSGATRRGYASDWRAFAGWCRARGLDSMPAAPDTVALYLAAMAQEGQKTATIHRALTAISVNHRNAGHDSPRRDAGVRAVFRGILRQRGERPTKKRALTHELLAQAVALTPRGLRGARDRALLLVGWSGAFRRSELAAVQVEHMTFSDKGLAILVPRSKTDQAGHGRWKGLNHARSPDLCPVRAARAWLDGAGVSEGPFLRRIDRWGKLGGGLTGSAVLGVVKKYAAMLGQNPREFGGHSLRSGFITSARKRGATVEQIMAISHHKDHAIVLGYSQQDDSFDNPTGLF